MLPVQICHNLRSLPFRLSCCTKWLAEQRPDCFCAAILGFHWQRWLCGGRSDTCIVHIIEKIALNLEFEWDEANVGHIGRHDVSPQEVEQVFANGGTDLNYELVRREERWITVGHTSSVRVLIVIWTMRGELVRVVTAFNAGKAMGAEYFAERGW
ncbi:MAG: BrnT family toxin [Acidobacteriia bacterium]|nr:BrnT family toxin [Terriglobia bacterium]